MPPQRKRRPGEANPRAAPIESPDQVAGGRGNDYGIARGIVALLDWRKRRKAGKAPRS